MEKKFELKQEYMDDKKYWQDKTKLTSERLSAVIEALVFTSEKPIGTKKLQSLIDKEIPIKYIEDAIEKIRSHYQANSRGIYLAKIANSYQFITKQEHSSYIKKFIKAQELYLTTASLEVLAIIAYRQPITRVDIEKIRGVDSSYLIRALIEKKLVKMHGQSNSLGRSVLYVTTREFLETFNLDELSQLPPENELLSMIEKNNFTNDITSLLNESSSENNDALEEGELKELNKIKNKLKNIVQDTNFTKRLRKEQNKKEKKTATFDLMDEYIELKTPINNKEDIE